MNRLFIKRRQQFHKQCLNYLKYVLNDHFVLVLLFLAGFLLYQYSQLLRQFPDNPFGVITALLALILVSLSFGSPATYLESADQLYLLPKEKELVSWIKQAGLYAFLIWGGLQMLLLIGLYPIFLALGRSLWEFIALATILLIVKFLVMQFKVGKLLSGNQLNWQIAIEAERRRQQTILKFFALFTKVKGISSSVKRRSYLDGVTKWLAKTPKKTWQNLYLRAFLRSGDYLALTLRLAFLALLAVLFIKEYWLGAGIAFFFNYLLAFQLLALAKHYDYQYLTQLFPSGNALKKANLHSFLRVVLYLLTLVEMAGAGDRYKIALLLLTSVLLVEGYLAYKVKKIID
ncbi:ABC transporter permease [Streptococcus plurextorum]|uniref:ABC transporter permease n=1 Tax=Streptococcus plurextorum TaxID=456876 RepID=UPI0003F7C56B|nr:ABC transporter permease [Streptococcus plurextorum]